MNNNDRQPQQERQRDGRNRQSQEFGRQGREDTSYRHSSSEGDDFQQANRAHYDAPGGGRVGNHERWQQGAPRQGEYAQGLGHGSPGYGGEASFGTRESYSGAGGHGGYGNAPSYGSGRDEYLGQGRGAQYAGPEFNPARYGGSGFEPSPYIGSQGGYPDSGYQSGYQGLPSGALGGYSAPQASYGGAYQGAYGPGSIDDGGRRAIGASYGQASGYGDAGQTDVQGHRGKGPKGYLRSDDRIKEDICERLSDDPMVDASDISVDARQGVVTLSGSVESRQLKHRVEDLIERCSGVKDIENRLTVKASSPGAATRGAASSTTSGVSSGSGPSSGGSGTTGSRPS